MTNTNGSRRHGSSPGAPALIRYNQLTFLIINQPTTSTLPAFIEVSRVLGRCCYWCVVCCERMSQHSYCSGFGNWTPSALSVALFVGERIACFALFQIQI